MPSLTVIIPTADRPDYLRVALQSVASQSARDQITDVLVSENLGNEGSRAVCDEFPDLPISYTLRDPQLGHPKHLGVLAREAQGDLIALLNDDDWWCPGHLAAGLDSLARHPDASAWHSATVWTGSEDTNDGHIHRELSLWNAAGKPDNWMSDWSYSPDQLLPLCWFYAPFHWTTMIARREPLHDAAAEFDTEHAWNADRVLPARLVLHGDILYSPQATGFARLHGGNYAADPEKVRQMQEADAHWKEKLLGMAEKAGVDVPKVWARWLPDLKPESKEGFGKMLQRHYSVEEIEELGFDELATPFTERKTLKSLLRSAIPYGIVEAYRHSK